MKGDICHAVQHHYDETRNNKNINFWRISWTEKTKTFLYDFLVCLPMYLFLCHSHFSFLVYKNYKKSDLISVSMHTVHHLYIVSNVSSVTYIFLDSICTFLLYAFSFRHDGRGTSGDTLSTAKQLSLPACQKKTSI